MRTQHALVLGLTLAAAGVVFCADDEPSPAEPDVQRLADRAGKKDWADLSKEGAAVAKKLKAEKRELLDVMNVFRKRMKDNGVQGIGVGDKPGSIKPDGIEAKIINMSLRVTQADLKHARDLARMAKVTAAVAAVATHMPNVKARRTPADIRKWQKYSREMQGASLRLAESLKSTDAAAIRKAATKLLDNCTNCHNDYR
jgi:hypothetical protein